MLCSNIMYAAGAWAACVPFLPQYLNSKAILRCRLAYFHWNSAPSREQSVHYIIILVSQTLLVNKNAYASLPNAFIYAGLVARRIERRSRAFWHKSLVLLGTQGRPLSRLRRPFTPDQTPADMSAASALTDIWTHLQSLWLFIRVAGRKGAKRCTSEPTASAVSMVSVSRRLCVCRCCALSAQGEQLLPKLPHQYCK